MSMTKAETAEMEALRRTIRDLESHLSVVAGTVKVDEPVGSVLLRGYNDQSLPLDKYFRVYCDAGQSAGLEVCLADGFLSVYCSEGVVLAIPSSSNVMRFMRGRQFNAGVQLPAPPTPEPAKPEGEL